MLHIHRDIPREVTTTRPNVSRIAYHMCCRQPIAPFNAKAAFLLLTEQYGIYALYWLGVQSRNRRHTR